MLCQEVRKAKSSNKEQEEPKIKSYDTKKEAQELVQSNYGTKQSYFCKEVGKVKNSSNSEQRVGNLDNRGKRQRGICKEVWKVKSCGVEQSLFCKEARKVES